MLLLRQETTKMMTAATTDDGDDDDGKLRNAAYASTRGSAAKIAAIYLLSKTLGLFSSLDTLHFFLF